MNTASVEQTIARIYQMPELKTCPIQATFRIIGKKWTVLILRELFLGLTQFNRIEENIKGITSKVLSHRLKELEQNRMVVRKIVSTAPVRVEYHLTELGRQMGPVLLSAATFSITSLPKTVFKDGKPRTVEKLLVTR